MIRNSGVCPRQESSEMFDPDLAAAVPAVLILLVLGPVLAVDAAIGLWRWRKVRRALKQARAEFDRQRQDGGH
jgi:hypothetical protein